jgi:hypothetical protein
VNNLGGAGLCYGLYSRTLSYLVEAALPDALIAPNASLVEVVEMVRGLPYGCPSD